MIHLPLREISFNSEINPLNLFHYKYASFSIYSLKEKTFFLLLNTPYIYKAKALVKTLEL